MPEPITIDLTERWLFVGKTGSGKTELSKYFLRMVESQGIPILIIDPKNFWLGKFPKWETDKKKPGTVDKPHLIDRWHPEWKVQIIQPDIDDKEPDERLPLVCYDILKRLRGGELTALLMYLDESEGIASATFVPRWLRRAWQQGRALGLGAWVGSQKPKGIPLIFKSQAEKIIAMKVGDEDAQLVADLAHVDEDDIKDLRRWEWIYYDTVTMDDGEWHPPVPLGEKANASNKTETVSQESGTQDRKQAV